MRRPLLGGRAVVVLALALAVLPACGGDDPDVGAPSPASPSPALSGGAAPEAASPGASAGGASPGASEGGASPGAASPGSTPAPSPGTGPVLPTSAWSARAAALRPLTEVAAAAFGGAVWVAGGYAADGLPVRDVQIYDPSSDTWSQGPPLPEAVHHAALVSTGDRLLLLGGYTERALDGATDAVRQLDPASGEWVDGPPLPEPRGAGAAAFDGERVVYGGGVGPDGLAGDVWALADGSWERVGGLAQPREHLAAAGDGDGRVFLLGGRTGGIDANLDAVDLVEGGSVAEVGALPTARGGVAGFFAPRVGACAAGGEGPSGTFAEVECVDAEGAVTSLPDLSRPRHGIGAATADGVAYVLLGGPEPGLTVSDDAQALPLGQTP